MCRLTLPLLVLVPLLLAAAPIAHAQPVGGKAKKPRPPARTVALIVTPTRKADAGKVAELARLIERGVAARGIKRVRMVAPFDAMGLVEGRAKLAQARKLIAGDHRQQRVAESERLLTGALFGLKGALGAVKVAELLEIYRAMAATRLALKDDRLARSYLAVAVHLKETMVAREFLGNSALKSMFQEVMAEYTTLAPGKLRVESTPAGAEVYVRDELRGFTPLALGDLKIGTHLVRLRRDGFYSHGWLADVSARAALTLHHRLKPMGGGAKASEWAKALVSKRTWKKQEKADAAAAGLRRVFGSTDLLVLSIKRTRKGYAVTGGVAPVGEPPVRVDVTIPIDATLLKRVGELCRSWLP